MRYSPTSLERSLAAWEGCRLIRPLEGGFRNKVYLAERNGEYLVIKTTRRSEAALSWLFAVQERAREAGFIVPEFVLGDTGRLDVEGVIAETFIEGEPLSLADKPEVLRLIKAFHSKTVDMSQRPGFASARDLLSQERGGDVDLTQMPPELVKMCREVWQTLPDEPNVVVHSDLNVTNLLRTSSGKIALLDWDETRVDAPFFDCAVLSDSLNPQEKQILIAWEVAVSWHLEPEYARRQARELMQSH